MDMVVAVPTGSPYDPDNVALWWVCSQLTEKRFRNPLNAGTGVGAGED